MSYRASHDGRDHAADRDLFNDALTKSVRLLLVENSHTDTDRVHSALEQAGAGSFTVVTVPDVTAAARELRARPYDLVLLGLARPPAHAEDGFEAIRRFGETLPVVVLGSLDIEDVALTAVRHGAQDYLVKDRLTVDLLVRSIRYARERHRLRAERTRRLEILEHELEIAALVQRSFLPSVVPVCPHHDIGASLRQSGQVGGDFYDVIELSTDRIAVAVGDAAGKGIPGAILMAETQGVLRAEARAGATPLELVRTLNRALCCDKGQNRFMTLFYGVLATETGRFTVVNAGHPRAVLTRATEQSLASTGPPLRLFADASWEEQTVTLGTGDRLVIYSDGVTEAHNAADEFFDLAGVRQVMAAQQDCGAAELARRICQAAEEFERGNPDPGDDKTVVVVRALDDCAV